MNDEISNLLSLSKNKYNINLLETIEHKELFQNLTSKINKNEFNNKHNKQYKKEKKKQNNNEINTDKDYFVINEEDTEEKEKNIENKDLYNNNNDHDLYYENEDNNCEQENSIQRIINKAKNSSKSFKNIVKKKLNNFKGLFNNLSPEKMKRCITQEDFQNNENNNKSKKNNINNNIKQEKIKKKEIDIKDFNFERNNKNNNLCREENNYYYSNQFRNDNENKNYFKSSKKNDSNISYYNHNDNTNNNLDVYNRLYNKSYYSKKKNNINTNTNEENNCTFNPQLLSNFKNKKNIDCLDNFIKRQEQFNKYIKQKKINLKKDINKIESKKYTFTPNTSCTSGSKYSIKLEAQRLEESNLDKANRLVYDSIKKMKEKNDNLFLMYNTQYSFIPTINKSKKINNKRNKSNDNNNIKYNIIKKDINRKREMSAKEEKRNIKKYVNHQYDNIRSNYKNDKELMNRINEENKKRIKRIDNMRKEQENEDFERCTFKPDIQKNNNYYINKLNNIKYNYFDNQDSNREMSYVDYYNKKKYYKNRLNRSQSSQNYNRNNNNNWYINSNINYNNYSNSNCNYKDNITDCEYDNCNDYSNHNYNSYYNNKCFDCNNEQYNFNYSDNNDNDNYEDYEKGRRSFSNDCYNNKNYNYIYMTPKPNKMYYNENKLNPMNEIKNEDKQNFLLINKLLYK